VSDPKDNFSEISKPTSIACDRRPDPGIIDFASADLHKRVANQIGLAIGFCNTQVFDFACTLMSLQKRPFVQSVRT